MPSCALYFVCVCACVRACVCVCGGCLQQGSDGYHRHWKGYGQIYTGPIHEGKYGGKDYLQVTSRVQISRKNRETVF